MASNTTGLVTHHAAMVCASTRGWCVHASAGVMCDGIGAVFLLPHFAPSSHHVNTGRRHIVNMQKFSASACRCLHRHPLRRGSAKPHESGAAQRQDHMVSGWKLSCGPYRLVGITGQAVATGATVMGLAPV
ncbi:hypothetical protein KCP74_14905 [Salmonella enterica subsp. enterica]|nr:hypothetical protein KCP74_14905 [Salmonella enterica subsp. enterica]